MFEWGVAPPLEKVIGTRAELDVLLGLPEIYRHSVSVLEPWKNVGINLQGESVRASKNIAYILQQVADADTILYKFTIDDPTTFTASWGGEVPFKRTDELIYEYACHEGNYALSNVLSGERDRERREAERKKSQQ